MGMIPTWIPSMVVLLLDDMENFFSMMIFLFCIYYHERLPIESSGFIIQINKYFPNPQTLVSYPSAVHDDENEY